MKTKITALALITATALSLAPKPAAASDKGLAIVGGFLGGLIVASAINDSRHDNYSDSNTTVVVNDRYDNRGPSGFWKEVSVRVWCPAAGPWSAAIVATATAAMWTATMKAATTVSGFHTTGMIVATVK